VVLMPILPGLHNPKAQTQVLDSGHVKINQVTPFYPRGNYVQWTVTASQMPAQPWDFLVERSENPTGPWTAVSNGYVRNIVGFFDPLPMQHIMRHWYYRVTLIGQGSCAFISVPQATLTSLNVLDDRLKGEILTMRNDLRLLLEIDSGSTVVVFKRRTHGVECRNCRSNVLNLVLNPHCDVCFGTGFEEGFYAPIYTRELFNDPPVQEGVDIEGESEIRSYQLQMLDFPLLAVDDLIFEKNTGAVYEVKNAVTTKRGRVVVHQEPNVSELERSNRFYKLVNNILSTQLGNEIFIFSEDFKRY